MRCISALSYYRFAYYTTKRRALFQRPAAVCSDVVASQSHAVVYSEDFKINPIPESHRFPMPKDALLYQRIQQEGLAGRTFTPVPADEEALMLVHDATYVRDFISGKMAETKEMRQIGLPWSKTLVQRTLIGVGSAIMAAEIAIEEETVVCMTNGGTHHAHGSHGSGWCIFNDLSVAARSVQRKYGVGNILMCDLDVHQGDGTASIFFDDCTVFTFSMHCASQSFPHRLIPSNIDVALPEGTGDDEYMEKLQETLPSIVDTYDFDLVMYNAGVDVHMDDTLGKLALSDKGIERRDTFVLEEFAKRSIPCAVAIGGGYEPNHDHIVDRHMILHRTAARLHPLWGTNSMLGVHSDT